MVKNIKLKMVSLPIIMAILAAYYFYNAYENMDNSSILLNILALAAVIISTLPNIKQHIYSDKVNFSVMGLGCVVNFFIAASIYSDSGDPYIFLQKLAFSIGGILLGGGSFYVMGLLGDSIFKKESVGGGDIKLVASIGALIGPSAAWLAPLWIPSALIFFAIYRSLSKLLKKYADSAVPSAPIHFTSLASFIFIQLEIINPFIVTLAILINLYAAYLIAEPSISYAKKEDKDEDVIDVTAIGENICPKCKRTNDMKAKFCGFCGEKSSPVKSALNKKSKSSFNFKQIIFVTIFLIYLTMSYFTYVGNVITNFHERSTELDIFLSEFQSHFIDSLIYIFDLIFSAFFVGLLAYWFKGLKTWIYLLMGFLMKYWVGLLLICVIAFKGEINQLADNAGLDALLQMLFIQIIAVLIGSYIGIKIAAKYNYSDKKDKTNFFFWGLSKKFWVVITIAYNPVLQFISKLSVFAFYTASKSISEAENWSEFFSAGYAWGVLIVVLIPFVVFAVSLKLFSIGINAVKNKSIKFRKVKIAIFLIGIPLLTVLIPIVRNRTWFF